jgi:thiopeptide-type bacteriocin biosynthesis protein
MLLSAFPSILLRAPLNPLDQAYKMPQALSPAFDEGLYLSSSPFWHELRRKDRLGPKGREKIDRTLSKYWIRSCMRSTPFGTFAGTALVNTGDLPTRLMVGAGHEHRRYTRIDMDYLAEIVSALARLPRVWHQLKFHPNNSLYQIPGGYRYAEYILRQDLRQYRLASVPEYAYINAVFARAREGATLDDLSRLLQAAEGVDAGEAERFLCEMLEAQLLLPALEPPITGQDPLHALIGQLSSFSGIGDLLTGLKRVQDLLQHPEAGSEHCRAIESAVERLGLLPKPPKHTLQSDLSLAIVESGLNRDLIATIVRQAQDLHLLAAPYPNTELNEFKSRFYSKYEEAEIPLSLALDFDLGVGYGNAVDADAAGGDLIDALAIPDTPRRADKPPGYIERFVFAKYNAYLMGAEDSITITAEDLAGLRKHTAQLRLPDSLFLMGSLLKQDGLLDPAHFLFDVSALRGPSAANLIARFIPGNAQLGILTREIIKAEEAANPGAVFAELVHTPQSRTANILVRPVLRSYEIPYLGRSGAPADCQIPVDDLMISIRNDEICLRSRRLEKQVIPRLTTAHNFSIGSLPVYKLLCDLQFQGLAYPNAWNWAALNALKHLPRVTYQNLILRKASWKISEKDISDLPADASAYPAWFLDFRQRHKLPGRVVYAEADNELLIDFSEARGIDLFLHYLRRHKNILLEEFLFTTANCVVEDRDGSKYTHELIIPLYADNPAPAPPAMGRSAPALKRKFPPNSEWQYFKIYCGSKSAENVLTATILPFVERGLEEQVFERFFFVRFRDDWNHLRIRFYNSAPEKQGALQAAFMEALRPLIKAGIVDKVLLDTYTRELERYGPALMADTEALFHNDSFAVLRFLRLLEESGDERYRMLLALRSVDMLLDDFGLGLGQKQGLLASLQADFFREFGAAASLRKQLNEQYRRRQGAIFSHLDPANDARLDIDDAVSVFRARSDMNQPVISSMKSKAATGAALTDVLPAHLHMFMNRLYPVQQRKYELAIYHFLEKYYTSQLAMHKKAGRRREVPELHLP